jgi:hypothetical protein
MLSKKSIVLLFIGLMFLSSSAFADQDGDYTYTASGGNATITGYTGAGGAISIPATLGGFPTVSIGNYAFTENNTITSAIIPASVTSIRHGAFRSCSGLTSVAIPNSVTSIEGQAFEHCTSLTSVTIPDSVTSIEGNAFSDCTALTSIVVDGNNPNYSSDAGGVLYNKGLTTLIQYPGGKSGAFVIPNSVTSIDNAAFQYCIALTSVAIPSSVTNIGFGPFLACPALTNIIVDGSNPNYSSDADGVLYNKDKATIIQYPGEKFGGFTIPNSVTSIAPLAFASCHGLTSVTIPDSVTSIGASFVGCINLTSINIPSSVMSIDSYAFLNCFGLTSAYFYGNAPTMGSQIFLNCANGFTVYYIAGNTGFTEPTWQGYPTTVFDPNATTTTTEPSSTTTSVPTTTTTSVNTTTSVVSSTTTTIELCTLTVEKSLLPLRAGLFARLRRIVIKGTNAEWDKESELTIDDINAIISRVKDEDTIIAWIIIPGKLISKFEPGTKEVRVQTPGKDDCTGEIVIE